MQTYLTFYPSLNGFINVDSCVIHNDTVPRSSCYATSLHDYLNLVNCGNEVTINTYTFCDELKTVTSQLADSLYTRKITFDVFTALNFILHKTKLAYDVRFNNVQIH